MPDSSARKRRRRKGGSGAAVGEGRRGERGGGGGGRSCFIARLNSEERESSRSVHLSSFILRHGERLISHRTKSFQANWITEVSVSSFSYINRNRLDDFSD